MNCDLHIHTNHSDGSCTPAEIVIQAKEKGLIVALTDHNTVAGVPDFIKEAERLGVVAVGGTELSTVYCGREFHLIGLFIEPEYYAIAENLCTDYHALKEKSNIDLISRLNAAGYDISYKEIQKKNVHGRVNRAHIAAELVAKGYLKSVAEAFDNLLDEKCGYYVPPRRLELTDGIRFLLSIKAVPVLAHPLRDIDPEGIVKMLPELIGAGLVGMETMHSSYTNEMVAWSKEIAAKFNLIESGGSDYHGGTKPGVMMGTGRGNLDIPDSVYFNLKRYKDSYMK